MYSNAAVEQQPLLVDAFGIVGVVESLIGVVICVILSIGADGRGKESGSDEVLGGKT